MTIEFPLSPFRPPDDVALSEMAGGAKKLTAAKLQPLGVYLASANRAELAALRLICAQQEALRVVGAAAYVRGVHTNLLESGAKLLLLDWNLPDWQDDSDPSPVQTVAQLIPLLHAQNPRLHIIVLTLQRRLEAEILEAGANGVVCKANPPKDLLDALQEAVELLSEQENHPSR